VQFHSGNSLRTSPYIPLAQNFNENSFLRKEKEETMAESRVYSITGGAFGISAATARLLAQWGASALWIAEKNPTNFQAITDEIRSINPATQLHTHQVDVLVAQEVDEWIDKIMKEGPFRARRMVLLPLYPFYHNAIGTGIDYYHFHFRGCFYSKKGIKCGASKILST
jgi:hypothetical protein